MCTFRSNRHLHREYSNYSCEDVEVCLFFDDALFCLNGEAKREKAMEGVLFADPRGVLILESFPMKGVRMSRKARSISISPPGTRSAAWEKHGLGNNFVPNPNFETIPLCSSTSCTMNRRIDSRSCHVICSRFDGDINLNQVPTCHLINEQDKRDEAGGCYVSNNGNRQMSWPHLR